MNDPAPHRRAELDEALQALRARIARACAPLGRDPAGVRLVAVTKTWPATDVVHLLSLGLTEFGENRDQEAAGKVAAVAELGPASRARWHFVGQVQRRKARSVARYADVVHSVDRPELVRALDRAATDAGRALDVLVQVSLDHPERDDGRGGLRPGDAPGLADAVAGCETLRLVGVMAVAPRGVEPALAFDRLAAAAGMVQARHPGATVVSAGMSNDLEAALAHGSTLLRVGTALLGTRPLVSEPPG